MSDDIHDEALSDEIPSGDSSLKLANLPVDSSLLKVYQTGELTVVGFGGLEIPEDLCIAAYRTQLFDLITQHNSRFLAFDLTGARYLPSGMLGVLVSIRKRLERVELYNPSPDILEALHITQCDRLFEIKEVAI